MQAGAFESAATDSNDTHDLLRGILEELKEIGCRLRNQDERIGVLERRTEERLEGGTIEKEPVCCYIFHNINLQIN